MVGKQFKLAVNGQICYITAICICSLIPSREAWPGNETARVHVPWLVSWTPVPPHHCTWSVWMRARERGKMVNIENRHLSEGHRSIAECNCSIIVAVVVSHSNTGPST